MTDDQFSQAIDAIDKQVASNTWYMQSDGGSRVWTIGIKDIDWKVCRRIALYSTKAYVHCYEFIESRGLYNYLDPGERADGCDALFAPDD